MNNTYNEFKNPSNQYRSVPFWSWNGKLEEKELLRQIDILKEMGFGGFFMHSRTGLITQYLSQEWFDLINACSEKALQVDMDGWLYDEDRWPSGSAGGLATIKKEHRMKFMKLIFDGDITIKYDNVIIKYAIIGDIDNVVSYRILDANEKLIIGEKLVVITIVDMELSSTYNEKTYLDTMDYDAVREFINITHEKYKYKSSKYFGNAIKGIFTDEPHRGAMMCGFSLNRDDKLYTAPYTPKLFDEFNNEYGYDLKKHTLEVFLKVDNKRINKIKLDYVNITEKLFLINFIKQIDDWCRDNSIILTGHLLQEDSLTAQSAMIGSIMRSFEYMEYPGVDLLGQHNRCYWVVKLLSSVANQLGKKILLTELDGCTGWQMPFQGHKEIGDWQGIEMMNLRCPHLSWYTMKGESKRDFPASILHQSAWYKHYSYIADYYARMNILMSEGEVYNHVLVINPIESVMSQIGIGWANELEANTNEIKILEKAFIETYNYLTFNSIDFDYGDEEMMSRLARIDENTGKFIVGIKSYSVIVVSGLETIRESTYALLEDFISTGGKVIVAGDNLKYKDCIEFSGIINGAIICELNEKALVNSVKECIGDDIVKVIGDTKLMIKVRVIEDGYNIVFLNQDRENSINCDIKINWEDDVERFDLRTGEITKLNLMNNILSLQLAQSQEYVIRLVKASTAIINSIDGRIEKSGKITEFQEVVLAEPNVVPLDFASYCINNAHWSDELEILQADKNIRQNFGLDPRGGLMLQPWYVNNKAPKTLGRVNLEFTFELISSDIEMMLALEDLADTDIRLNGTIIPKTKCDYKWVDICFNTIKLSKSLLLLGRNTITLEFDYKENRDIETIYLLGEFSVNLKENKPIISNEKPKLNMGDMTTMGIPFYGGIVKTKIKVPKLEANQRLIVHSMKFNAALLEFYGNNNNKIVAFAPYKADITELIENNLVNLDIILTRRNTFGPLHLTPKDQLSYGPDSFISTGDNYTDNYMLFETGIDISIRYDIIDSNIKKEINIG